MWTLTLWSSQGPKVLLLWVWTQLPRDCPAKAGLAMLSTIYLPMNFMITSMVNGHYTDSTLLKSGLSFITVIPLWYLKAHTGGSFQMRDFKVWTVSFPLAKVDRTVNNHATQLLVATSSALEVDVSLGQDFLGWQTSFTRKRTHPEL